MNARRARVAEEFATTSWPGETPSVAVLVSTYGRPKFLGGLVDALAAQDLPSDDYEVVIVDNGSTDDTWEVLTTKIDRSPLRAMAVRVADNCGPGPGRNAGAAFVRAPLLAITDDDCLPSPSWLREIVAAFVTGADVVQGSVRAEPEGRATAGPWDHTKWILSPTPFLETCNVAYRRSAFERAGGFDETDPLLQPATGRAFGEDACLAWDVIDAGGRSAWVPEALVHHRRIPSTYERYLADIRERQGFPGLARRSPLVASWLYKGIFLDRTSAAFDLALVATTAAAVARRPWPLVGAAPWIAARVRRARRLASSKQELPGLFGRLAWSDVVSFRALVRGSVRHRRIVL